MILPSINLNGTRLEKRSPREMKFQPRNGGQKTNLQLNLTRVETNGVSIRKLNKSKKHKPNFLNKNTGILAFFGE